MPKKSACSVCCASCLLEPRKLSHTAETNPYALCNFLPAGTVSVKLLGKERIPCQHAHSEDGWHKFPGYSALRALVTPEDEQLVRLLDFLVQNIFVAATCQIEKLGIFLIIRIYLIPWDLANVQGNLRVREEASVVAPARLHMKALVSRVIQDDDLWEGQYAATAATLPPFFKQDIDNRSMAEIYSDLPSPTPLPQYLVGDVPGMRSELYDYQRRTVSTMLSRELSPGSINDPLYVPITGIDGSVFFYQPVTTELLRECPGTAQARGGILCEELGTGKTVMMLALILVTLDQLPAPEESVLDARPVLTPLSFNYSPTDECMAARQRISSGSKPRWKTKGAKSESASRIPPLVEILLHYCRVQPDKLNLRMHEEEMRQHHLWKPLIMNNPFYLHYEIAPENTRLKRKNVDPGPKVMFLSGATLIIVPRNLFRQWHSEVMKHCHDTLRVLEVTEKTALPSAAILASQYDIILMTYSRFSGEASKNKTSELYSWSTCSCPGYRGTRVPKCRCKLPSSDVTPLLQIRWKRLVIDEGHISASLSTNLTPFAKTLSVERRWIVTGTPTTNLLGLQFGINNELMYPEDLQDSSEDACDSSNLEGSINSNQVGRKWSRKDREDLRKLSLMIVYFLGMPQFSTKHKAFQVNVVDPLMESPCPRPGAIQVLTQVMDTVMIRHRIADIEHEVMLPLLSQETVFLDLDSYALKSYNAMQAMIVINAVDSERKDQDYLFHPSNAEPLAQLVQNMSQVMFWHVDDEGNFNVDGMIIDADKHLERALKRNVNQSDLSLLRQAIRHVRCAVYDPIWRALQNYPSVFHRVHNVPTAIYRAWTSLPETTNQWPVAFLHGDRLHKLQEFAMGNPLASADRLITVGEGIEEESRQRHALLKRRKGDSSTVRKEREVAKQARAPEKREEVEREFLAAQKRMVAYFQDQEPSESQTTPLSSTQHTSHLLSSSLLVDARIGNSTSSKLDYILREVLKYSSSEKFLIFSNSPLTLAYVAEGLELIRIKFLQYTTRIEPKFREQLVWTFESSDLYQVFLMELKHGARGLNLVSASRVIFCEPVWQADAELQAIKRVHRIGQTKPVTVKTLAIRSTWEEVVVTQRQAFKMGSGKEAKLTDDRRIRDFIANPIFLEEKTASTRLDFNVPLLNIESNVGAVSNETSVHQSVVDLDSVAEGSPPQKKRRVVRFADERDD